MRDRDGIKIVFTGLVEREELQEEPFCQTEGQRKSHAMIDAAPVPPLGTADVQGLGMCWGEAQGVAESAPASPTTPIHSQAAA